VAVHDSTFLSAPPPHTSSEDIPYKGKLKLDIHFPAQSGSNAQKKHSNLPAIIYFVGGCWGEHNKEGKKSMKPYVWKLVEAGYAIVAADYRTDIEEKWPAQGEDVEDLVRFLKSDGSDLGIDPDHLGCWGESSGAQLCTYLATKGAVSKDTRLNVAVNFFGQVCSTCITCKDTFMDTCCPGPNSKDDVCPVDFLLGFDNGKISELCNAKKVSQEDKKYVESSEPLHMLSTVSKGKTVPIFTGHGDADEDVNIKKAKMFVQELEDNNVVNKFVIVPKGEHHFDGPKGCWDTPTDDAVKFIKQHI
jgi:acetyl esterase/lipase